MVSGRYGPKSIRPRSFWPKSIRPHLKLNTFELKVKYTSVYHFKMFLIDFNFNPPKQVKVQRDGCRMVYIQIKVMYMCTIYTSFEDIRFLLSCFVIVILVAKSISVYISYVS
jgi:hypothetical protein